MSGGSMNYLCYKVEDYAIGKMGDPELNAMAVDLVKLFHDCEWWRDSDIGEEEYRETVRKFKAKWLAGGEARSKRLEDIIEEKVGSLRKELLEMIGVDEKKKGGKKR